MEILSVPLKFTSNPTKFDPLAVSLVFETSRIGLTNQSLLCLMRSVIPADGFFSFESWAQKQFSDAQRESRPSALIAFGGAFAVGGYQVNHIGIPSLTSGIDIPIVHISHSSATALAQLLQQFGGVLNITITDFPENPFFSRKSGAVFLSYSIILCLWNVAIIIMSVVSLRMRTIGKNLGTLCLFLDIVGASVRFCWALDPFADRFIPPPIIDTLFTASWPMVLSGTIVLLLFWHELATIASLNVTSVLDRHTVPAVVVILILFIIEILSDSFRATRFHGEEVHTAAFSIYLAIAVIIVGFFIYVFVVVVRFLRDKGLGGKKETILRAFSIRAICCVLGLLIVICVGIGYAVGVNYTEHGEGALNFIAHAAINMISTAQVLALLAGSANAKTSKSPSSKSQTHSHIER